MKIITKPAGPESRRFSTLTWNVTFVLADYDRNDIYVFMTIPPSRELSGKMPRCRNAVRLFPPQADNARSPFISFGPDDQVLLVDIESATIVFE